MSKNIENLLEDKLDSLEGIKFTTGESYLSTDNENPVLEITKGKVDLDKLKRILDDHNYDYNESFLITDQWGKEIIEIYQE